MERPIGTILNSPDLRRLRAMEMLQMRIANRSIGQIAEHFQCSVNTVSRALEWAEREGLVKQYENEIIQRLVPKAIALYEKRMEGDDADPYVAKDIIDKLIKLGDRFERRQQQQEELGVRGYIANKRLEQQKDKEHEAKTVGKANIAKTDIHQYPASTAPTAQIETTTIEDTDEDSL